MEYTVKTEHIEKIKVDLPCYVADGAYIFYKIVNEEKIISIQNFSFSKHICFEDARHRNPFASKEWKFITESMFNDVFVKVFSELEELLPKTVVQSS